MHKHAKMIPDWKYVTEHSPQYLADEQNYLPLCKKHLHMQLLVGVNFTPWLRLF